MKILIGFVITVVLSNGADLTAVAIPLDGDVECREGKFFIQETYDDGTIHYIESGECEYLYQNSFGKQTIEKERDPNEKTPRMKTEYHNPYRIISS